MSAPELTEREIAAAVRVLRSGRLSLGPMIPAFERAFANYVGAPHAVAVSSGTAALHLALIAAGVADGDCVVTSPVSFVASANCILFLGATPIFVDVDPATATLDLGRVEAVLDDVAAGKRGPLPPRLRRRRREAHVAAILPVHLFGRPIDMSSLMQIARARDVAVVEDACETLGAEWDTRRAGTFGDMGCFGFYPNKQLTTGEGGMIVTGSERGRPRRARPSRVGLVSPAHAGIDRVRSPRPPSWLRHRLFPCTAPRGVAAPHHCTSSDQIGQVGAVS